MMKAKLYCTVLLMLGCITLSLAAFAQEGAAKHSKVTAELLAKAGKLYQMDCALCHGETGNGQTDLSKGMGLKLGDWTKPDALAAKSDDDLFAQIRKGKNQMPSEDAGRASDDVVWALIAYIRKMPAHEAVAKGGAH